MKLYTKRVSEEWSEQIEQAKKEIHRLALKQRESDDQMSLEKTRGMDLQKRLDEKSEEIRNLKIEVEQQSGAHGSQVENLRDTLQNQRSHFKQMVSLLK